MSTGSGRATAPFVADRPVETIRVANPWQPFAHYITVLPAAIEGLSAALRVGPGDRLLDFGCADRPYRGFFGPDVEVVSADLPGNHLADVHIASDGTVPVPDGSFDAVLSTQVLEHVEDPALYLAECARVLRPGGRLLLATHGIFYFHPDPVDYWRWTCEGLRRIVGDAGFVVVEFEGVFGMGATGLQLTADAVLPKFPRRLRPLARRVTHALIAFVDQRQSAEAKRLNASVYVLVAEKPGGR